MHFNRLPIPVFLIMLFGFSAWTQSSQFLSWSKMARSMKLRFRAEVLPGDFSFSIIGHWRKMSLEVQKCLLCFAKKRKILDTKRQRNAKLHGLPIFISVCHTTELCMARLSLIAECEKFAKQIKQPTTFSVRMNQLFRNNRVQNAIDQIY